jgi:ABC-type bacteriocin/lantibiotic exporter with double-glycine peptidase domain
MAANSQMPQLKTESFKQTEAMCGPACLKIVAGYFGRPASAEDIAKLCRSSLVSGTTGANLVRGARRLGFSTRIVDHADYRMIAAWLRKGVPVIVDWMSTKEDPRSKECILEGHYSVVSGLTRDEILLEDPAHGRIRRIPRPYFLRAWFDFTYFYPKQKDDLVIRRMIVVAPEVFFVKNARSSLTRTQTAKARRAPECRRPSG